MLGSAPLPPSPPLSPLLLWVSARFWPRTLLLLCMHPRWCREDILESHICRRPTAASPAALAAKLKWLLQQVRLPACLPVCLPACWAPRLLRLLPLPVCKRCKRCERCGGHLLTCSRRYSKRTTTWRHDCLPCACPARSCRCMPVPSCRHTGARPCAASWRPATPAGRRAL